MNIKQKNEFYAGLITCQGYMMACKQTLENSSDPRELSMVLVAIKQTEKRLEELKKTFADFQVSKCFT